MGASPRPDRCLDRSAPGLGGSSPAGLAGPVPGRAARAVGVRAAAAERTGRGRCIRGGLLDPAVLDAAGPDPNSQPRRCRPAVRGVPALVACRGTHLAAAGGVDARRLAPPGRGAAGTVDRDRRTDRGSVQAAPGRPVRGGCPGPGPSIRDGRLAAAGPGFRCGVHDQRGGPTPSRNPASRVAGVARLLRRRQCRAAAGVLRVHHLRAEPVRDEERGWACSGWKPTARSTPGTMS